MRMADARKRLGLIAAIIVAGSLATAYTDHFITTREKEMGGEFEETSLDGISGTVEEMIQETEILAESFFSRGRGGCRRSKRCSGQNGCSGRRERSSFG